jgi:hypothetical protein
MKVKLPNGSPLSPQRFLQLGMFFGFHGKTDSFTSKFMLNAVTGGFDTVHGKAACETHDDMAYRESPDLVLRMCSDLEQFDEFTRPTLSALQDALPFDDAIIYAILHEPIYCQGFVYP